MSKVSKQVNKKNNLKDDRVGTRMDNLSNVTENLWNHENLKYESRDFYNNEGASPKKSLNIRKLRDDYLDELLKEN